jgi:segregation and condensation protein B
MLDWQLDGEDVLLNPVLPEEPLPTPVTATKPLESRKPPVDAAPPPVERILEAMLFVGAVPLNAAVATQVIRGLTEATFHTAMETLIRTYRKQNRPYHARVDAEGYSLVLKPQYREVREKLYAVPKEARLSQPALDVLAMVAYRQPITKAELDSVRGADSGLSLRQLLRLGLVVVTQRGEAGKADVAYGTTPRFLSLFQLTSLDDLPRLGDSQVG